MDKAQIQKWTLKLPRSPEGHWGMGHLPVVQYIQQEIKPETMMEIGLNNGTSAAMWLFTCPQVTLQSIDIGIHKFIDSVVQTMEAQFGERFSFLKIDSRELCRIDIFPIYDLVFIDGGHKHDVCLSDLNFAKDHARFILLDDTGGNSPGVTSALKVFPMETLQLIKRWGMGAGCALYKNLSVSS